MHLRKLCLAALFVGATSMAHGQNLVQNPGFETGDLTGWATVGPVTVGTPGITGSSAAYFAQGNAFTDTLTQTLATTTAADYDVSFNLQGTSQFVDLRVYLGTGGFPIYEGFGAQDGVHNFTYTATTNSDNLEFWADFTGDTFLLDNVSVTPHTTPSSTPEPGSVALLIGLSATGAGFLGRTRLRKTR